MLDISAFHQLESWRFRDDVEGGITDEGLPPSAR